MVGDVSVLFTSVSEPASVVNVPVTGNVTFVGAVTLIVVAKAPAKDVDAPMVKTLEPLLAPVPPYVGSITVPCQTPVPIVPMLVRLDSVATLV